MNGEKSAECRIHSFSIHKYLSRAVNTDPEIPPPRPTNYSPYIQTLPHVFHARSPQLPRRVEIGDPLMSHRVQPNHMRHDEEPRCQAITRAGGVQPDKREVKRALEIAAMPGQGCLAAAAVHTAS